MTTNDDRDRIGLTGAFLGNILARVGDGDALAEEENADPEKADWYPYDDPAFDNASFEDEEAYLAGEELGLEGGGLGEGFGLGL